MSLVCVDELKLLKDIERLIKREIPRVVFDKFKPDPSIKAVPINTGRGARKQNGNHKPAGKHAANDGHRRSAVPRKHAGKQSQGQRKAANGGR